MKDDAETCMRGVEAGDQACVVDATSQLLARALHKVAFQMEAAAAERRQHNDLMLCLMVVGWATIVVALGLGYHCFGQLLKHLKALHVQPNASPRATSQQHHDGVVDSDSVSVSPRDSSIPDTPNTGATALVGPVTGSTPTDTASRRRKGSWTAGGQDDEWEQQQENAVWALPGTAHEMVHLPKHNIEVEFKGNMLSAAAGDDQHRTLAAISDTNISIHARRHKAQIRARERFTRARTRSPTTLYVRSRPVPPHGQRSTPPSRILTLVEKSRLCFKSVANEHWPELIDRLTSLQRFRTSTSLPPAPGSKGMRLYGTEQRCCCLLAWSMDELDLSDMCCWPSGYAAKTEFNVSSDGELLNGRQRALVSHDDLVQSNAAAVRAGKVIKYNEVYLGVGGASGMVGIVVRSWRYEHLMFGIGLKAQLQSCLNFAQPLELGVRSSEDSGIEMLTDDDIGEIVRSYIASVAFRARVPECDSTYPPRIDLNDHAAGMSLCDRVVFAGAWGLKTSSLLELFDDAIRLEREKDQNGGDGGTGGNIDSASTGAPSPRAGQPPASASPAIAPAASPDSSKMSTADTAVRVSSHAPSPQMRTSASPRATTFTNSSSPTSPPTTILSPYSTPSPRVTSAAAIVPALPALSLPPPLVDKLSKRAAPAGIEASPPLQPGSGTSDISIKHLLLEGLSAAVAADNVPAARSMVGHVTSLRGWVMDVGVSTEVQELLAAAQSDSMLVTLGVARALCAVHTGITVRRMREVYDSLSSWLKKSGSLTYRMKSWHNESKVYDGKQREATNLAKFMSGKVSTNRKNFCTSILATLRDFGGSADGKDPNACRDVPGMLASLKNATASTGRPCLRLSLLQHMLDLDARFTRDLLMATIELAIMCGEGAGAEAVATVEMDQRMEMWWIARAF